ncbi:MAG: cytochrome P460 family protein, partial [Hyphomicrobiales bacterium]|nr:cytochrome P460 family protein [Hyphomicrobiales bacterium]
MWLRTLLGAAALGGLAVAAHAGEGKIEYPEGYRNWSHVKSMVLLEGHALAKPFQGIHHLYANPKALAGYRSGDWRDG